MRLKAYTTFKQMALSGALLAIAVGALLDGHRALASIPDENQCVDMKNVVVAKPPDDFLSTKTLATYLPAPQTLTPTTNQDLFITQFQNGMGQKITDSVMNGPLFKQSSIGKFANDVQKATSTSLINSPSSSGGVNQQVNVNIKAVQRTAEIVYKGYFNSTVSYLMDQNNISLAISKPLDSKATTTLSLTNVSAASGTFAPNSMLSLTHIF